jgi:hypothetical protein
MHFAQLCLAPRFEFSHAMTIVFAMEFRSQCAETLSSARQFVR